MLSTQIAFSLIAAPFPQGSLGGKPEDIGSVPVTQLTGALVLRKAQQPGYLGSGTGLGTGGEARVGYGRRVAAPGPSPSLLSMAAHLQQPCARKDFKAPWERVRGLISDVCHGHGCGE